MCRPKTNRCPSAARNGFDWTFANKISPHLKGERNSAPFPSSLGGQLKLGLHTTPIRMQVVLGQGSADLLMTVVVFVHNPGRLPSPNGGPFQSAPSPTGADEVDPPSGMCRWRCLEAPESVELTSTIRRFQPSREAVPGNSIKRDALSPFHESSPAILHCLPRNHRRKTCQRFPETLRSSWRFLARRIAAFRATPRPANSRTHCRRTG